jgi:formylglycine-generating enzyme required for sulfatase activity
MSKFLIVVTLGILFVLVTGCGGGVDEFASPPAGGADTSASEPADTPTPAGTATATPYTLATPTPLPPPPTPTPIPPTPTPEPKEEQAEETEKAEEPEPETPLVTNIMIEIPAGPFTMGSDVGDPEDMPAHEVDLPAFKIDKFEVTNIDFFTFADETGYVTYGEQEGIGSWRDEWGVGEDSHPVVMVSWDDANAYCEWLGKRLPTEAEWEKAARGEDGRTFTWGNDWDPNKANVKERGLQGTAAVGSFGESASVYGVEDMIGNVWEWTTDWYQAYPGNTADDPYYGEKFKVTRGGGWFDVEPQATTFNRNAGDPLKTASDELGFRCAQ